MDADVRTQICEFFDIKSLLKEQEDVICAFQEGRDVFVCIPTGMGKSLTFQSIGFLRPEQTVLVFSPLVNIIIDEQTAFLNSKGLSACSINQVSFISCLDFKLCFVHFFYLAMPWLGSGDDTDSRVADILYYSL